MIISNVAPSAAVKVIFDTATEGHPGLCPVLLPYIDDVTTKSMSGDVPSERAVRIAVEEAKADVPEISGFNHLSDNTLSGNVFQYSSPHNQLYFKSIKFDGPMYPTTLANHPGVIYLASTQLGIPSGTIIIDDKTLNGGINQCVTKVGWEELSGLTGWQDEDNNSTGIPLFRNYEGNGKVIGKILIKCDETFSFSDKRTLDGVTRAESDCLEVSGIDSVLNYLCISTDNIIEGDTISGDEWYSKGFTKPFAVPARRNSLVNFDYGETMLDKVAYLNDEDRLNKIPIVYDRLVDIGDWNLTSVLPHNGITINTTLLGFKFVGGSSTADIEFEDVSIIPENDVELPLSSALGWPMPVSGGGLHCKFKIYADALSTFKCSLYENATEVFSMRKYQDDCEYYFDDGAGTKSWVQLSSGEGVFPNREIHNVELYNFTATSGYSFDVKVNGDYIGNCINCAPTGTASTASELNAVKFENTNSNATWVTQTEFYDKNHLWEMPAAEKQEYILKPGVLVNDAIKLYKLTPYQDSTGELTVIVFYDDFKIERDRGDKIIYVGGNGSTFGSYFGDYEIFNYETNIDARIRGQANGPRAYYGTGYNEESQLMYTMGGARAWQSGDYVVEPTVERMDIVNYVPRVLPAVMVPKVYRFSTASTYEDVFAFGGYTSYATVSGENKIQQFNYATEVMYDSGSELDIPLSDSAAISVWPANQEMYILGGRKLDRDVIDNDSFDNRIRKFDATTKTPSIGTAELFVAKEGTMCVYDGISKIYIAGGAFGEENLLVQNDGDRDIVNTINTLDIVTNTMQSLATVLTTPKAFGAANTNIGRSIGYFAGGGNNTPDIRLYYASADIDIVNFTTDTDCIKCKSGMARERIGIQGVTV